MTLFLKFAREIGGYKKRRRRRRRGTFVFYPLFFCFQPNSRATKRARLQASEARGLMKKVKKNALFSNFLFVFTFAGFFCRHTVPPFLPSPFLLQILTKVSFFEENLRILSDNFYFLRKRKISGFYYFL